MKEQNEMKSATKRLAIRSELKTLSDELDARASAEGRELVPANQLLREAYGLKENAKLHTFEGWKRRGGSVRKGEKALLFWGKPRKGQSFCPVVFLFSSSQVAFAKKGGAQ